MIVIYQGQLNWHVAQQRPHQQHQMQQLLHQQQTIQIVDFQSLSKI